METTAAVSEFPQLIHVITNDTSTNLDEHVLLMHPYGYIASAIALFCIGFFGFFLNLIVIVMMLRDKQVGWFFHKNEISHKILTLRGLNSNGSQTDNFCRELLILLFDIVFETL